MENGHVRADTRPSSLTGCFLSAGGLTFPAAATGDACEETSAASRRTPDTVFRFGLNIKAWPESQFAHRERAVEHITSARPAISGLAFAAQTYGLLSSLHSCTHLDSAPSAEFVRFTGFPDGPT
jgi:hypothetical protein